MEVVELVWDIVKCAAPTVKKYVKYQIRHNDYVNEFKEVQRELGCRREEVAGRLRTQLPRQPGKTVRRGVEAWLKKANQETAEKVVEDLICKGGCFTYMCSSRKLEKRTQSLNELILQLGENYTEDDESLVVVDNSIKGVQLPVDKCCGRDEIQDQILDRLKGDNVTRIVVSGMGGVGKTTIMKHVHNKLLKEPKFDKVIWVTVSTDFDVIVQEEKQFNILKFQKKIASSLELKLEPADYEDKTKLSALISQRLQQGSLLLILDNVWKLFPLEEVGIPNPVENNGCKLVFTTRSRDVARTLDCDEIHVKRLPPDVALALFLEKVGPGVFSTGKIKRVIEQILQKCDGVPLAIVAVAKSMKKKLLPRNWKLALSEFGKYKSIFDCLKFSYDMLESSCQECFLYCALYPENYEIPKEELIEYWIEEGLMCKEGKTREHMNCIGHGILDKLVDNCLLELGKREYFVSMHYLIREMALKISPHFLVRAGMALQKLPEEHEWREDLLMVSLMRNHITEIPSNIPSPKCPKLTTLLLSNNKFSTIPEAFFEHMLGLKILDLSNNPELSRLPSSVSELKKLTTLLLGDCKSLREVPSISNLVDLKKLDLSWTPIEELPQGLNMLTNLKYLGLGGRLSETVDELLQNLSKLQHLIVNTRTKFKWETIGSWGKLQNLEKLNLRNLDNLNAVFGEMGAVAESAWLPDDTFSSLQYISVFECNKIKKLFSVRWLRYLQNLQSIEVHHCEELEEIIGSESDGEEEATLPNLESLRLIKLPQLKSIYSGSNTVLICDSINKIEIHDCKNIVSVFWSGFNPLSNLESLDLSNLDNLKSVFDEEGLGLLLLEHPTSLFSLKEIKVEWCHQLKKVFSSGWLLRCFQSLETIEVLWCLQLEELISSSAHKEENVSLPNLQSLRLIHLHALKSIYNNSSVLICDSIQSLRIIDCDKLMRIPLSFPLLDTIA